MAFLPTVGRGVAIGWFAGLVQLPAAQIAGLATGHRERADVALRLVQRAAERVGWSPSRPMRWLLATFFHFGYASWWGALYALGHESGVFRRIPWWLSGGALGGAIYVAAFSRLGGGTLVGSERPPERRRGYEWVVQWASALSFALTTAYIEQRVAPDAGRRGDDGGDGEARV